MLWRAENNLDAGGRFKPAQTLRAEFEALLAGRAPEQIVHQCGSGVSACPNRVTAAYLELAVLVRALQSLSDAARMDSAPDASSLWAGLFDLRDTLLGSTVGDLRAIAV